MAKQVVALQAHPSDVAAILARRPGSFALDGGNRDSWNAGKAWFGSDPRARMSLRAAAAATADPFGNLEEFARRQFDSGCAAIVVALSYDLGRFVERIRSSRRLPDDQLLLHAAAYDAVVEHDYSAAAWRAIGDAPAIAAMLARCTAPAPARNLSWGEGRVVGSNWTQAEYSAAVERALRYIAAGDIYQVNLAQQFRGVWSGSAAGLFAAWRDRNPAPFAAYLDCGGLELVSNSPECFLSVRNRHVATYPIKGTRRRSPDREMDRRLVEELTSDPKERAEHVMIVDLERNDLGRVCTIGSVRVSEFAQVHSFPAVHHLVSSVEGQLRPEVGLAGLLRATFPGGSITGAPKIRAMEVIDEIEPLWRGFYTGALGILWPNGDVKLALTIRTASVESSTITYPSGGGIVADSTPEREYEETLLKAQPFFTVLAGSS